MFKETRTKRVVSPGGMPPRFAHNPTSTARWQLISFMKPVPVVKILTSPTESSKGLFLEPSDMGRLWRKEDGSYGYVSAYVSVCVCTCQWAPCAVSKLVLTAAAGPFLLLPSARGPHCFFVFFSLSSVLV